MTKYLYEQPLNEQTRTFLRLDKLFQKFEFHQQQANEWNDRIAIDTLLEILVYTARGDIKMQILKELDRQHHKLNHLAQQTPEAEQLNLTLKNIKHCALEIQNIKGKVGQQTREIELLSTIAKKNIITGIVCDFDLPVLKYWFTLACEQRQQLLGTWFLPFIPIQKALQLILSVLRESTENSVQIAQNGFYQQTLNASQAIMLLGVSVHQNDDCYPEISAGKHRFSIRFMKNDNLAVRPEQYREDVPFKLIMHTV